MNGRIEQKFDETANLNKYTNLNTTPADPNSEYVIGDLHANAWLMLYFFQREGIASFSNENLRSQYTIYHKQPPNKKDDLQANTLTKKDLEDYKTALKNTPFNPVKKIHFIGDTLADRGMGDHYILYNYQALAEKNIAFDVALSNHDLEFIVAYWRGKREETVANSWETESKLVKGELSAINYSSIKQGDQVESTLRTEKLSDGTDSALIERTEIAALVETYYLPHVNLISYTLTEEGIVLMTHAPVDFELIRSAADALGVSYCDDTALALAKTIDAINAAFQKKYIQTGAIVDLNAHSDTNMNEFASHGGIRPEKISRLTPDERMTYIVGALTWNRTNENNPLNRPATHRGYNLHYVHGHTKTKDDPDHVSNLDSVFGKQQWLYTPEGQSQCKEKYGVGYRVLRCEALQVGLEKIPLSSEVTNDDGPEKSLAIPAQDPLKKLGSQNFRAFPGGSQKNDYEETIFAEKSLESSIAHLNDIKSICEKLQTRYAEKIAYHKNDTSASALYKGRKHAVDLILNEISDSSGKTVDEKISAVGQLYTENQDALEKEHEPISKNLIKALKVILVSLGLVAGVVPGLIALGIFTKSAFDRTGNVNFLSDEANKTSQAIELKSALDKGPKI